MKRFRFIIKRLLSMIVIMFLVSFLVFVVLRMSDADPLTVMIGNNQSTPELRQALTEKYHLDDPVHIQYLRWIKADPQTQQFRDLCLCFQVRRHFW